MGALSTGAAVGLVDLLSGQLAGPVTEAQDAVVRLCIVALMGCVVWAWAASSAVVWGAWRGGGETRTPGVPHAVRRLVLAACGVALLGSVPGVADAQPGGADLADHAANPAHDSRTRPHALAGLPMPDRAVGPAARPRRISVSAPPAARVVIVRAGDSLWSVAAADLPAASDEQAVARHWEQLLALNQAAIGPDPDLIHPGLRLRLPPR